MGLGLTGHHGGHAVPADTGTTTAGLQASLTTNQTTYTPGQVVQMTFTETNTTGHVVFVDVGPSNDGFSITRGGQTVWRSHAASEYIVHRRLLPGQSITLTSDWTAKSVTGMYAAHNQLAPNAVAAEFQIVANSTGPVSTTGPVPSPVITTPNQGVLTSPSADTGTTTAGLEASLTTNQTTYTPGQVVQLTFTETNTTGNVVFVDIGPGNDGFSITSGGQTIWRSHAGAATNYVEHRRLAPGQSFTLAAAWTADSVAGTYVAHNQLAPNAVAAEFQIV